MNTTQPRETPDEAIAVCSASIRAHSKSFALASRLLPQPARDEAVVLYAWCRRADDAVDEAPHGHALKALSRLQEELKGIYGGDEQSDPVLAAFQIVVQRRSIPRHYPEELLAGMAMDVSGFKYRSREDLLLYCYRVASVVGLMMCHVMGVRRPHALLNAAHLGAAMQLTNICRDVVEDWGRGRVYLPDSAIVRVHPRFNPPKEPDTPFANDAIPALASVVRDTLNWADEFYSSGDKGVIHLDVRSGLAIVAARLIYSDIGRIIRRHDCDVTAGRAFTTRARKLILVARSLFRMATSIPKRLWLISTGDGHYQAPDGVLTFDEMRGDSES